MIKFEVPEWFIWVGLAYYFLTHYSEIKIGVLTIMKDLNF